MTIKKIRRLGVAALAAAVLATGGAVVTAPTPASATDVCSVSTGTKEKLRYGDSSFAVYHLQCILRDVGYKIGVDGKFGQQTLNAVRRWQASHPYLGPVDGVVGPKTWASLRAGSSKY